MPKMDEAEARELLDDWYALELERETLELDNKEILDKTGDDPILTPQEKAEIAANNQRIAAIQKEQAKIVGKLTKGHAFGL